MRSNHVTLWLASANPYDRIERGALPITLLNSSIAAQLDFEIDLVLARRTARTVRRCEFHTLPTKDNPITIWRIHSVNIAIGAKAFAQIQIAPRSRNHVSAVQRLGGTESVVARRIPEVEGAVARNKNIREVLVKKWEIERQSKTARNVVIVK